MTPIPEDQRYNLRKERRNMSVRQQYYSYHIVNAWNGLPSEVVEAPSLNVFKARLDIHCKHPVFDVYNPIKTELDRPQPDTGL